MSDKKKNILLLLGSICFLFLALESYARIKTKTSPYLWQMDLKLGYKPAPNTDGKYYGLKVKTNSKGLRDNEYSYLKKNGVFRIVALGDSFTYGLGIKNPADIYIKIAEKELKKKTHNAEIINMAVGGYNTKQEVDWFKTEGVKYGPDMVILGFTANDNEPALADSQVSIRLQALKLLELKELLRRNVYLWTYLVESFRKLKAARNFPDTEHPRIHSKEDTQGGLKEAGTEYTACIDELKAFQLYLKARGIKLIVFLLPPLDDLKHAGHTAAYSYIQRKLQEGGITAHNLFPCLQGLKEQVLWFTPQDHHPNELCNRIFSEVVTAKLSQYLDKARYASGKKRFVK